MTTTSTTNTDTPAAAGFTYRMAPTPREAAEHVEAWQRAKREGVEGLPAAAVEWQDYLDGEWQPSIATPAMWASRGCQDIPRHAFRLVVWPVAVAPGVREAAEALIDLYSPLDFTEDRVRLLWADLRAALAAEGDEK